MVLFHQSLLTVCLHAPPPARAAGVRSGAQFASNTKAAWQKDPSGDSWEPVQFSRVNQYICLLFSFWTLLGRLFIFKITQLRSHEIWIPQEIISNVLLYDSLAGFKQAGFQPDVSDLHYLRLEQGLGQNLPDYLTADFRSLADAFFDVDITIQTAQDAYSSYPSYLMCRCYHNNKWTICILNITNISPSNLIIFGRALQPHRNPGSAPFTRKTWKLCLEISQLVFIILFGTFHRS